VKSVRSVRRERGGRERKAGGGVIGLGFGLGTRGGKRKKSWGRCWGLGGWGRWGGAERSGAERGDLAVLWVCGCVGVVWCGVGVGVGVGRGGWRRCRGMRLLTFFERA
jgi:hypothetical protein